MRVRNLVLLFITSLFASSLGGVSSFKPKDRFTVYIFLHDACVISQYYTLSLSALYDEYANDQIQFIGLFPDFSSKPGNIEAFKFKYDIPFTLKADYFHDKKEAFGATVTPEVVVYNETQEQIIYQGRIDNTYARVGQRRRVTTTSELKDVLEAIHNAQPILISKTDPVGCFITKNKLSIN